LFCDISVLMQQIRQTRLRALGVRFPFMVAPMVGVSNLPFRELVRSYLPSSVQALLFTEMLSSRRLSGSKLNTLSEVRFSNDEIFLVAQLLANEEILIEKSMERLHEAKVFGVDINMGCPVSHTIQYNWGVKLMGDIAYASKVVGYAKKHSKIPVSVKMRASAGDVISFDYLNNFTAALEDAGADWITIHGRSKSQKHSGKADFDVVANVAAQRKIAVVANGDVQTASDAVRVIEKYSFDGVMIGRGAVLRPWILGQIAKEYGLFSLDTMNNKNGQESFTQMTLPGSSEDEGRAYLEAIKRLLDLYEKYFSNEKILLKQFRFFLALGSRGLNFGHHLWSQSTKAKTLSEMRQMLHDYPYADQLRMSARIEY